MRKSLVAGNWKMNGSRSSVDRLTGGILSGLDTGAAAEVLVCPPHAYLSQVAAMVDGSALMLGGQDLSEHESGAHTGEVSGVMLADHGCTHVIVGHSERRALLGEDNELVARKFIAAQKSGLTPVLCVGETLDERRQGVTIDVISRQVEAVVTAARIAALGSAVVAYEPVWAIGTGETATPEQAQEVHDAIRSLVATHDAKIAADLRILYGGSVKGANARELFSMPDIDGGLIGGASLDAEEFLTICAAAA